MSEKLREILVVSLAVIVLGVLMGGVYSAPAMWITNNRDPWLTILLSAGLSAVVVAIGVAFGLTLPLILAAWGCSCTALLIRRYFGKLDHNLERFGLIHAWSSLGTVCLALMPGELKYHSRIGF